MKRTDDERAGSRLRLHRIMLLACIILLVSFAPSRGTWAGARSSEEKAPGESLGTPNDQAQETLVLRGRMVFLRNCRSCHGLRGDGNGEYAPVLQAKPRDFTAGVYKWRSTPTGGLPTDEDLMRTIARGITQSGMPAFAGMHEQDLLAVVAYTKSLSPRFTQEPHAEPLTIPFEPAMTTESVQRGRLVYERMGCASCHGSTGNGWGPLAFSLMDDDGNPIRPADLTGGSWKGGCQGNDLYRSILTGLDGTPMPSFAQPLGPDETWALVHYLQSFNQSPLP